jgi:membrane protease YdiL (CAAX protease family)
MRYILRSVLFCVAFTVLFIILSLAKGFIPHSGERLAHGILGTLAALIATIIFLRVDKKKFADIGLSVNRYTLLKFFFGVVVGILVMGIMVISVWYFTTASISLNPGASVLNFLLMTLPLIPLAFMEELGFRAYPLEIVKNKIGIRWAILLTSIVFALYHIVNGWTVSSSFLGPAIWGLLFGLAAIYSKGIAMPTGIHYAANLTTSAFGITGSSDRLWIVEQGPVSPAGDTDIDWATILPAFGLLIFAILCIEIYLRRRDGKNDK